VGPKLVNLVDLRHLLEAFVDRMVAVLDGDCITVVWCPFDTGVSLGAGHGDWFLGKHKVLAVLIPRTETLVQ
jgi:hypothetical protein